MLKTRLEIRTKCPAQLRLPGNTGNGGFPSLSRTTTRETVMSTSQRHDPDRLTTALGNLPPEAVAFIPRQLSLSNHC